jgi:hypothetical protein
MKVNTYQKVRVVKYYTSGHLGFVKVDKLKKRGQKNWCVCVCVWKSAVGEI